MLGIVVNNTMKRIFLLTMIFAGGMLAQTSPATDALDALRALKSVTEMGVSYRDFLPRVADAKIKVDRYLESPANDEAALRGKIKVAMRLYVLSTVAWSNKIQVNEDYGFQLGE